MNFYKRPWCSTLVGSVWDLPRRSTGQSTSFSLIFFQVHLCLSRLCPWSRIHWPSWFNSGCISKLWQLLILWSKHMIVPSSFRGGSVFIIWQLCQAPLVQVPGWACPELNTESLYSFLPFGDGGSCQASHAPAQKRGVESNARFGVKWLQQRFLPQ